MAVPLMAHASTATMPKRIQRKRTAGWRMPAGAVYVGRPTKWGNPFVIGRDGHANSVLSNYEAHVHALVKFGKLDLGELRGKTLACWCPIGSPCHADVLLCLANQNPELQALVKRACGFAAGLGGNRDARIACAFGYIVLMSGLPWSEGIALLDGIKARSTTDSGRRSKGKGPARSRPDSDSNG